MKRVKKEFSLNIEKEQFFLWANQSSTAIILDSNQYPNQSNDFDFIIAIDAETHLLLNSHENAFDKLKIFKASVEDWIFGFLSYDLKNDVEALHSKNDNSLHFPELFFFQPKKILLIKDQHVTFLYLEKYSDVIDSDFYALQNFKANTELHSNPIFLQSRTAKAQYLKNCHEIISQIHLGKLYEANYCIEFFGYHILSSAISLFIELNTSTRAPFATFLKHKDIHILSNSPERFLKKEGNVLTAQPIKGTRKRGLNAQQDAELVQSLQTSVKDRAENTMIVDLVRNDLSKIAKRNSIHVIEYCKIYTFESVHQMISTIQCKVDNTISSIDIIKANFPMGSMTGAPKISAMKCIELFEDHKRSAYSGTIGYIAPNDDFDFNVVIRSLLYNSHNHYLSLSVGGAITALSNPEEEYAECLTKAKAIQTILQKEKAN